MSLEGRKKTFPLWLSIHLGHIILLLVLYFVYKSPVYSLEIYEPWKTLYLPIVLIYAVLGWLPVRFSGACGIGLLRESPYFLMLALIFRRLPFRKRRPASKTYWRHKAMRYRWMMIFIKSYYLPLVVGSFYFSVIKLLRFQNLPAHQGIGFLITLMFLNRFLQLLSSMMATVSYTVENKRFGYPVIAAETSLIGIFFCIICYPPAQWLPARFLTRQDDIANLLFAPSSILGWIAAGAATFFFGIYVLGIFNLGLRFANLTYRGTQAKGLFAVVRHPQYSAKLLGFFFEWLPFFTIPVNMLLYLGWVAIYVCRTLSEERFLKQFPDYRAYCEKVKWRFIPGIW